MTYILTARERTLLESLQIEPRTYRIQGQLPVGIGAVTLERLTGLGLLETGPGRHGTTGWRLSEDGWRCMYGRPSIDLKEGGPFIRFGVELAAYSERGTA